MRVKNRDEGLITLLGAIFLIIIVAMFFLFMQSYTLIICANWFPITMIILAFAVFYYVKNKSEQPRRGKKR